MKTNAPYSKHSLTVLVSLLFSLLLACQIPFVIAQESFLNSDPLEGQAIFKAKGCQTCHAIRGQGGNVAKDLGWHEYYGSALDLAKDLWNHSPIMAETMEELHVPRPAFTVDEMGKVMTFLYYLRYLEKPGNVLNGKKLLSSKGCLSCHSVRGQGKMLAPRLDKLSYRISPLFMAEVMWNHGPAMEKKMREVHIKWPEFKGDEIVELTNYLRILRKDSPTNEIYLRPGNPTQGKILLSSKGCLKCHALHGKGGQDGPDFSTIDLNKSVTELAGMMWNHGEKMMRSIRKRKMLWPKFEPGEMGDLIAYLYYVDFLQSNGDPGKGEEIFTTKGCKGCHVPKEGQSIGPDLLTFKGINSPVQMAQIMWNHAPVMAKKMQELNLEWPKFTRREIENLYAFLSTKIIAHQH